MYQRNSLAIGVEEATRQISSSLKKELVTTIKREGTLLLHVELSRVEQSTNIQVYKESRNTFHRHW